MLTKYDRDRHMAEIYDATETQTEDIRLLRELIGHRGPLRVREPFCGTGRILIPLAQDGHIVVGTDISEAMLEGCRQKVGQFPPEVQARITLRSEDAVTTSWGSDFDLVILGANCLYELSSEADQRACIRHGSECVKQGGLAYVDNNARHGDVSEADLGHHTNWPTGACQDGYRLEGDGRIVRVDSVRNLWFRKRSLKIIAPDGQINQYEYETSTRPVSMEEVRDWLEAEGLEILHLFGSRRGDPFTEQSGRAIFWARKT